MSFEKLNSVMRLKKLSGFEEVKAQDITEIAEEIELSEREVEALPRWQIALVEGKIHVMDFTNKFVLRPVKDTTEDKTPPKVNDIKTYTKDGGDAKKVNKKMKDNDLSESTALDEGEHPMPYRKEQVDKAEQMLKDRKSKLGLAKDMSKKEKEDAEYEELMRKKKEKEDGNPDKFIKSNLSIAKESASAEDATVFAGSDFTPDDEEEYFGKAEQRAVKVKKPRGLINDINKRIAEIKKSIDMYDDKGYDDGDGPNSIKNKAIDALQDLKGLMKGGNHESYKQAQVFFLTIMNPIQALFPTSVVKFLSGSTAGEEPTQELTSEVEPFETKLKENSNRRTISDILEESKSKKKRSKKMKGEDPCWNGYKMVGHKTVKGKEVPNCVPVNEDAILESAALVKDYEKLKDEGKKDSQIIDSLMSMEKYRNLSKDKMAKIIGDHKRKDVFKR